MPHRSLVPVLVVGLLAALASVLAACRTTQSERPSPPDPAILYRTQAERAWDVTCAGEPAGSVVWFTSASAPERSVWVVRNTWGQDLGWIDSLGRAYRLLPHHKDPAWVGTGTVQQGVERILGSSGACELVERALEGAEEPAGEPPAGS